ncbi:MAG: LysR family transcriptional regulator [Deltaproteobacteria bacterium]|nr:MAG: LysR family transcriptional regulator [Deltaproteobacteria bacterium]
MDRLQCMEGFVRVAEAGSFAEAARRWGRSKAVMSKYVAQLEAQLAVRLFERTTRTLALTPAGEAHLARCREILDLLDEAEAAVRDQRARLDGTLRLTAPPGFLAEYLDVVTDFARTHPDLTVDIDASERLVDLVAERVDVAVRLTRPTDSSLIARRLAPVRLLLVASPEYLEAHGRPTGPEDLVDHRCILDTALSVRERWPLREGERRVTVEVRAPLRINGAGLVRDVAVRGLGIALVPELVVREALADGTLEEVLVDGVDWSWSIWAVTPSRTHLPARVRAFLDHLGAAFQQAASG